MNRTVIKCVFVVTSLASLTACANSKAPSCRQVAESAVRRALREADKTPMPDKVRDELAASHDKLAASAEATCKQRGWSAKVRRCKVAAETELAAAACE